MYESTKVRKYFRTFLLYFRMILPYLFPFEGTVSCYSTRTRTMIQYIYVRCSTKVSISGSTCTVHVQYFRTTLLKPLLKIESEASLSPPPAAGVHTEHRVAYKVLC